LIESLQQKDQVHLFYTKKMKEKENELNDQILKFKKKEQEMLEYK